MKLNHFLAVVFSLLFTIPFNACVGKNSFQNEQLEIKEYIKIEFEISNKICESIGYKVFDEDEDVGVKSIFIYEDDIYLTDVYNSSIKKISIKEGKIKSSICLSSLPCFISGIWLRDIAVFDNKIFVSSDADSIYVFSLDLQHLETVNCKKGNKTVYSVSNDSLLFYIDSEQQPNLDIKYDLLLIQKNIGVSLVNKIVSVNDFKKRNKASETKGINYTTFSRDGKFFIEIPQGIIELKETIPSIKEYSGNNIHFTDKYLVYFNSNPNNFVLHIYYF